MNATIRCGSPRAVWLAGTIISVALVFCGSSGRAEGLTGIVANAGTPSLTTGFTRADLAQLEHATAAAATAARLAAMGVEVPELANAPSRTAAPGKASVAEEDVFRHSVRLLPMLVTGPDAATPAIRLASTIRPRFAQAVGVPAPSLPSKSLVERYAR